MTVAAAASGGERREPSAAGRRMPWGGTISAAFVASLVRPEAWALALAGFLARGGIVLVALPILVLPTPTGLQNALGGPVSTLVFGAPSTGLAFLVVGLALAAVLVFVAGTWVAAWTERAGIALALEAAAEEGLAGPAPNLVGAPGPGRIAVVRMLGLAPLAGALLAAWQPVYDATYRQLVLPDDLATPLPLRVVLDVPWLVIAIAAAWLLGDAAASIGVRRLVLERQPVPVAWLLGWIDLLRRPLRAAGTALVGVGLLALLVAPALVIAAIGWARVRDIILAGREPLGILVAIGVWVAMWLGSLTLVGVAAAVRNSAWTFELPRRG